MPDTQDQVAIQTSDARRANFDALKHGLTKHYVDDYLDLEPRQLECILKLVDVPNNDYSVSTGYFHACTAFGKTYLIKSMAAAFHDAMPSKKIIVIEESVSVLKQIADDLTQKSGFTKSDIGRFYGACKRTNTPVIVCTYASMNKLLNNINSAEIGLVLCDEAHHILSDARRRVAAEFSDACIYGFSATPRYDMDRDCGRVFGGIIDSITIPQGVDTNLLCSFKTGLIISRIAVDLTNAITANGEYDTEKMSQIMRQSHIVGIRQELADYYFDGYDEYLGKIFGRQTIINAPTCDEADALVDVFNSTARNRGLRRQIACAYHSGTGTTPLNDFNRRKIPVIVQVNRITEGYNNKHVEICINYPTTSAVKSVQRGGRALRYDNNIPNKIALILDIAFMRRNSDDALGAIHENKQVLFMDNISRPEYVLPHILRAHHQQTNIQPNKKINTNPNTTKLLNIVTDIQSIGEMISRHAKSTQISTRTENDIGREPFKRQYIVKINNTIIPSTQKYSVFEQLITNQKLIECGVVKYVHAGKKRTVIPVLDGTHTDTIMKHTGISIKRNPIVGMHFTELAESDITYRDFVIGHTHVCENGTPVPTTMRHKLFVRLVNNPTLNAAGVIKKRKSRTHPVHVIDGTQLRALEQIAGITIVHDAESEKLYEIKTPKQENDIGRSEFRKRFCIIRNGQVVRKSENGAIFDEIVKDERMRQCGIVKYVKAPGNKGLTVIDVSQRDLLLSMTGIQFIEYREMRPTDIRREDMARNYIVTRDYDLSMSEKRTLFDEWQNRDDFNASGIVGYALNNIGMAVNVIDGTKLDILRQITGYTVRAGYTPIKQEYHIDGTDFCSQNYIVTVNGETLSPNARKQLFVKLRKNPELQNAGIITRVNNHTFVLDIRRCDELTKLAGVTIEQNAR
ncbi:MAG: DEAD/DEAH box helicase family protein [Alphaproteobacteria bacterium]|nr:DEAD/DEAH box helicase family protein [Alphaproteobacteria bacterium]